MIRRNKCIAALCALVLAVFFAACSAPAGGDRPSAFTLEGDVCIAVNGVWFPIYRDAAPLLAALGDGYTLSTAPSCVFDGEDKEFSYDRCTVFTNPDGDKDIWYQMLLHDDSLATARGIKVGDDVQAVYDAYGDGYYWEGDDTLTYSVSGVQGDIQSPCIIFTVIDEQVSAIEIYYPTNAE